MILGTTYLYFVNQRGNLVLTNHCEKMPITIAGLHRIQGINVGRYDNGNEDLLNGCVDSDRQEARVLHNDRSIEIVESNFRPHAVLGVSSQMSTADRNEDDGSEDIPRNRMGREE